MDEERKPIQVRVLEYSAPPLLFAGSYRFRSTGILVGAILLCVFAGGFSAGAVAAFREPNSPPVEIAVILCGIASVLTLAAASVTIYRWFVRGEITLRVTEEGVEYWGRIRPWPQIAWIGGVRTVRDGVFLVITPGGGFRAPRSLLTTPTLTTQQFASLMHSLQAFLRSRYPSVTVELEPRDEL